MSHNCQLISTFGILALEKRRLRLLLGGWCWAEKCKSLARLEVPISLQRSHDSLGQRIVVWPGSAKCSMDFNHGSPWISPFLLGEFWRSFGWCSPPWRTTNSGRASSPIQLFDIFSKMLRKNMLATGGFLMPFYKFLRLEGSVSQFAIEGGGHTTCWYWLAVQNETTWIKLFCSSWYCAPSQEQGAFTCWCDGDAEL